MHGLVNLGHLAMRDIVLLQSLVDECILPIGCVHECMSTCGEETLRIYKYISGSFWF